MLVPTGNALYSHAMQSVKVSSKRQISLPSDACRRLGIAAGDRLNVEIRENELILRRRPATAFERLWGLGAHIWEGIDPVEFTRSLRDEFERTVDDDR
jgi:AbrB family looped-hinge helix DNA binding protein